MTVNFDAVPEEFKAIRQWCVYKLEMVKDKKAKVPYQISGHKASSTDPKTWTSYSIALNAYENLDGLNGICFMFSEDNGIIFIDLDTCIEDGVIEPWALDIVNQFNSYSEISQSGHGIHILARGKKPGTKCRTAKSPHPVEIYDHARQCCITGNVIDGHATIESRQAEIDKLYFELFGKEEPRKRTAEERRTSIDDNAVIRHAKYAANGAAFRLLWDGSTIGYNGDESAADLALMNLLAFWTSKNAAQMERLFSQSALGQRDKWTDRPDYRDRTIQKSISDCRDIYQGHVSSEVPTDEGERRQLTEEDVLDIDEIPPKQEGDEPKYHMSFNHSNAVDAIREKLPAVLGEDDKLYYWQGSAWTDQAESIIFTQIIAAAGKYFRTTNWRDVLTALRHALNFNRVKFDPDPYLLGVLNGVVDLRMGTFREYQKEDYISCPIDVKYDPLATCPRFIQYLIEVCPRVIDRLTLIDWIVIHAIAKQFPYILFLLGLGRNGKGIFEKVLKRFFGKTNFSFMGLEELSRSNFAKGNLQGKRGLIVSEAGDESKRGKNVLPTKFLKASAGEDTIDSDVKNKERVQFDPIFKSTIDCNDMPVVKDTSKGWMERFCKVDMPFAFVDNPDKDNPFERPKDPHLLGKLTTPEELSGILNLIIYRVIEISKTDTIIKRSGEETVAEYLVQSNSVKTFLNVFCAYDPVVQAQNAAALKDVYASYDQFCRYPPKETVDIARFGANVKKFCNNQESKKYGNIRRYPGFVFYEDEFIEYMKSQSNPVNPVNPSKNSVKTLSAPVDPVIIEKWSYIEKIFGAMSENISHIEQNEKERPFTGSTGGDSDNSQKLLDLTGATGEDADRKCVSAASDGPTMGKIDRPTPITEHSGTEKDSSIARITHENTPSAPSAIPSAAIPPKSDIKVANDSERCTLKEASAYKESTLKASKTCAECGKNILPHTGRTFKGESYCGPNCIQYAAKRLGLV